MAPRVGLEPTTFRLTAERSAIELPRSAVANTKLYQNHWGLPEISQAH